MLRVVFPVLFGWALIVVTANMAASTLRSLRRAELRGRIGRHQIIRLHRMQWRIIVTSFAMCPLILLEAAVHRNIVAHTLTLVAGAACLSVVTAMWLRVIKYVDNIGDTESDSR